MLVGRLVGWSVHPFRKRIFPDCNEIKGFFSDIRIIRRKTAKFFLNSGISELFSKT
jgi:hypothetical protein